MTSLTPVCFALKSCSERIWADARLVEKSEPEQAELLKSLAKSNAKLADEIANKQGTSRKEIC